MTEPFIDEKIVTLRKIFQILVPLSLLFICLMSYIKWRDYHAMKKRVELTVHYRLGYSQLYKSFGEFDWCFGDPSYLFASESNWLACDLKALRHAYQWNQGQDYLRYMIERDQAFVGADYRMYVPIENNPPMPRR